MKKAVLLIIVFFISINMSAQEPMKKLELMEGKSSSIKYNNLNLETLLQVYDETSAAHLIGDIYLAVYNNDELIANFYLDHHQPEEAYYTKIYNNYFLTFEIEQDRKYLIIEKAHFGKAFGLSTEGSCIIAENDDLFELEITDYTSEYGYDAPPEDENRTYFSDVHYTLKIKTKDLEKNVSFNSSEVKDDFVIEIGNYRIQILSDTYKDSSALIEMIIHKK